MSAAMGLIRDKQQSLLWSTATAAPFTGAISESQLRVRWNVALRAAFGLSASQSLRGGPLQNNRIDASDRQRIKQASDSLIESGVTIDLTFKARIEGRERTFRIVIQRVEATDQIIGVLQDCHVSSNELATTVSLSRWQSVGRLTLLDEVASAMAHELNQPLAAIATFSQAGERLLNLPEPRLEKAKEVFQEVATQALRAGELIRHMRSLVKRQLPQRSLLSIADLCRGFAAIAEPMARTHHVGFNLSESLPAAMVDIDVIQINQVLGILFQNAIDALSDETLPEKIITLEAHLNGTQVVIGVIDSGRGIGPEVVSRLFQPFFSTKENGTGLGLISARNILEIYGSRLDFANLPGGGCRFSFSLTVAIAK